MASPSPDDVCKLTKPTDGFLCPLSANTFGIEFLSFTISDYESKKIIFEVGRGEFHRPPPSGARGDRFWPSVTVD